MSVQLEVESFTTIYQMHFCINTKVLSCVFSGTVFDWYDILAFTAGILGAILFEKLISGKP
jgi:hypothetical protein